MKNAKVNIKLFVLMISVIGFVLAEHPLVPLARDMVTPIISHNQVSKSSSSQQGLDCDLCHSAQADLWMSSRHANTQYDVAEELVTEAVGETPESVVEDENCVACHAPTAVLVGGGMTEAQVMAHFFTTSNGVYTDSTTAVDTADWPHVACISCHSVPVDHPATMPVLEGFNSSTVRYDPVKSNSELCGRCHGSVRFADTDHRDYDAWQLSRHGHGGQSDVASELAAEWVDKTPDEVINGPDSEDCIACHAPTAVKMNNGITEAQALENFFTTGGGVFTSSTVGQDEAHWPEVACDTCHDPHDPGALSYFNSATSMYQLMSSSNQLCGQCHGDLRFPDTDHLSYNIETGTGGVGVPDQVTMPGVDCVDCHMHAGEEDGTNSLMYGGHAWSVFIHEPDGSTSASCTRCHAGMDADLARTQVDHWQEELRRLDAIAQDKVAAAEEALKDSTDQLQLSYLAEAKDNLEYAESDESGGVHNHNYVVILLNDAIDKADLILGGG